MAKRKKEKPPNHVETARYLGERTIIAEIFTKAAAAANTVKP